MYKVEYIADKKIGQSPNEEMYLVKWAGYDLSYASWQPLQHLSENCLDLIQQFENNYGHLTTTIIGKVLPACGVKKKQYTQNKGSSQKQLKVNEGHKKIVKQRKMRRRIREPKKSGKDEKKRGNSQSDSQNMGVGLNVKNNEKPEQGAQTKNNGHQIKQTDTVVASPHPLRKNSNASEIALQMNRVNKGDQRQTLKKKSFCLTQNKQESQAQESHKKMSSTDAKERNGKAVDKVKFSFTPIIIKDPIQYHHARKNSFAQRGKLSEENRQNKQANRISLKSSIQEKRIVEQKQPLDIIGMRKKGSQYEFYVVKNSKKIWMSHQYLFENYSKELCKFYQKNMILE